MMHLRTTSVGAVVLLLAAAPFTSCRASEPPPAGGAEAKDEEIVIVGDPANAEELLDRLEQAEKSLENFEAGIHRRVFDAIFEETLVSVGDIYFDMNRAGEGRRFAILFKRKGTLVEAGDAPQMNLRDRNEHYIFDGQWLVEKNIEDKQFIKRRMGKPGEKFDALSLDGPLPMPFGQSKAEVLRLFDVELVAAPAADSFLAKQLKDVWGLRLTPKPGTRGAEQFESVTVFYDRGTLLPAGIDALKVGGNRDTVWLFRQKRNAGFDANLVDVSEPSAPGWKIDRRDWQDEPPGQGGPIAMRAGMILGMLAAWVAVTPIASVNIALR